MNKIKTLDELAVIIQDLKKRGKKIVQCHGVFDLLHPGHIRHFEAARKEGDILIVTLTKDKFVNKGPGRPVFNQRLRAESIAALESVDFVAINEWPTATNTIKKLRPDIYVKGSDYSDPDKDLTGEIKNEEDAVRSIGGRIHFTDDITFSSTKLLNMHFSVYPEETEGYLKDFREKYTADQIIKYLKDLSKMKVLVIGDTIIDEYHYCSAMGKSSKENIIPTRYLREETFAGGVLAAANHIAGFCKEVHLVTCLGSQNSYEGFIKKHLKPNVKTKFIFRDDAPTTVKRRFIEHAFLSKLFEVCFLNDRPLPEKLEKSLHLYLKGMIKKYDMVLVGDFGHGFIEKNTVEFLADKAGFLVVNAQTNSANAGFNLITKYPRADYMCIDEPELRLAMRAKFDNVEGLITKIAKSVKYKKVIVTLGHKGSIGYSPKEGFSATPVFSKEIIDRMGAGDAFLSITAPCAARGYPMDAIGFIGNAVGALKVLIVGNRSSVEPAPLYKFITTLLK
ncbi:MAG: PfkB family carbohydrate kinase [Candidatus Omnitrophota bacterium]|nr:PfkB family carbohydrate kinase [Candidatus Omnitrophota bacterium]